MRTLILLLFPILCQATITIKKGDAAYIGSAYIVNENLVIDSIKNVVIDGYILDGLGLGDVDGISVTNCNNVTIKNCNISNFGNSGILVYKCNNLKIENCITTGNLLCGIWVNTEWIDSTETMLVSNSYISISNCQAFKNPGRIDVTDNWSGSGILMTGTDSGIIENCVAYENGINNNCTFSGPVGIWMDECRSSIIRKCKSYRNSGGIGQKDGGGFDLDGGCIGCTIEDCESYYNEGAGYGFFHWGNSVWKDNIARRCSSINDGINEYASISFWGILSNTEIYDMSITRDVKGYGVVVIKDDWYPNKFTDISVHNSNFCLTGDAQLNGNISTIKMIDNTMDCQMLPIPENRPYRLFPQKETIYFNSNKIYNNTNSDVKVYNISGQFVYKVSKGVNDLSFLLSGVYIARIKPDIGNPKIMRFLIIK